MPILPSIQGNEQVAYDMSRAHSADIFFIKMRYGMWTAIIGIGGGLVIKSLIYLFTSIIIDLEI